MKKLTHVDKHGTARMVDVSAKPVQLREAVARGTIFLKRETLALIATNQIAKGDVLHTARLAGIQAAKRTGELIPLCHPLNLTHVDVDLHPSRVASKSRRQQRSPPRPVSKWKRSPRSPSSP
jgi:cyclic pyranopterin phosphate synthase